jgi:hypothetical protein
MVSQTCKLHADFRDLHSNAKLARIFVLGSVFSGSLALATDLADPLMAGPHSQAYSVDFR